MRQLALPLAFCLAGAATVAAYAATTGEEDAIQVIRQSATDFEVVSGSFVGGNEYFWCGAATYTIRRQGQSARTPIYIKRGVSARASGHKSVVFTTNNAGLPPAQQRLTMTISERGASMRAVDAQRYCRDAFTRSTK